MGIIAKENMRVQVQAADWKEAIRQAGGILEEAGSITAEYTESMVQAVETFGPYIVMMPGFAIAHAAPAPSVKKTDMAMLNLAQPVCFGSPNDPVKLMLCLACVNSSSHVDALQAIAMALDSDEVRDRLANAQTVEEMEAILAG